MTATQLETHVGSLAVTIYALIQTGKFAIPAFCEHLTGWRAVALNFALSAVTVLATTDPANRFSGQTFIAILLTTSTAAGIHGTVSKMSKMSNPVTCGTILKSDE